MSVKIMIDSASDINEAEAKELGFLFIPIQVMLEDEEYLDGVNLLPETFFDKLPTCKTMPRTSLINSFRWDDEFEKNNERRGRRGRYNVVVKNLRDVRGSR